MSNNTVPNPNVPQIPQPLAEAGALAYAMQQVKQGLDSLAGHRGNITDRAVTFNDLLSLGSLQSTGTSATGATVGVIASTPITAQEWQAGQVTALGGGLSLSAATLSANWQLALVTSLDAGLTLTGGTLSPNWRLGAATAFSAGVSLVTTTLTVQWRAGDTTAFSTGISLVGTTLTVQWRAGNTTALDTGLSLVGTTLTPQWQAGSVTSLGSGLSLVAGVLTSTATGAITPTYPAGVVGNATGANVTDGSVGETMLANGGASSTATVTLSITSPGVVTWTGHPFSSNKNGTVPVQFTTTGALPTGLAVATLYWVIPSTVTANTFQVATTVANAFAGTAINFTGSQSGTQTCNAYIGTASGSSFSVAALQLTAGDWDLSGAGFCNATAATIGATVANFSASLNSGTAYYSDSRGVCITGGAAANANLLTNVTTFRINVSGTTIVYFNLLASFTSTTVLLSGFAQARRR